MNLVLKFDILIFCICVMERDDNGVVFFDTLS